MGQAVLEKISLCDGAALIIAPIHYSSMTTSSIRLGIKTNLEGLVHILQKNDNKRRKQKEKLKVSKKHMRTEITDECNKVAA